MDKKLLGKRINTARKDRGWTSERLSEACNINATYLRQIESGAKTPSLQVFVTLCSTLNVSPTYLLADNLNLTESQDLDSLLALCRSATPKQMNMIVAILTECAAPSSSRAIPCTPAIPGTGSTHIPTKSRSLYLLSPGAHATAAHSKTQYKQTRFIM